jgi:hypothetical protein
VHAFGSIWRSIVKVAQHLTAQAGLLLTLLGIVQLSVDINPPFPVWVPLLGAIALLAWTACWLQWELDESLQSPKRDKHLQHAVYFALHGRWPTETSPTVRLFLREGDFERGNGLLGELRRHARDGTVRVWGQPYSAASKFDERGVLRPIEREYWDDHGLDLMCLAAESLESVRTEHDGRVREAGLGLYCGLMVSRREVEAIWPPRRKRLQLRAPWQLTDVERA